MESDNSYSLFFDNERKNSSMPNASPVPFSDLTIPPCQWILYADVNNSRVRVWDIIILVPNSLFLLFLCLKLRKSISQLTASSSPIFTAFYVLIFTVSVIGVLRCVVSMTVNAATTIGDLADKILWLVLRFFLLATELSVVVFGLGFGHLDSRTSIRLVLFITFATALAYSAVQCILELKNDHPNFNPSTSSQKGNGTENVSYDLFAHGGMIFLFTSSVFFFLVYVIINLLPFTRIKDRFLLPTKKSFYIYCSVLAVLNLCQAVASLLLYFHHASSLCVIDVTSYIYFSLYNPLVYIVFLWKFFRSSGPGLQFSYKSQDDEMDDDQLSLPYSAANNKTDDQAPIFSHESTHFDVQYSGATSAIPSINSDYNPKASLSNSENGVV